MATLTLSFTTDNNPTNGYVVKYRETGTSQYTTVTPNPMSSPVTISGLLGGTTYEGTIQGDCGNNQFGTLSTFNATVAAQWNMARDPSSASNACSLTNFSSTFFTASSTLAVQTQLYADSNLQQIYTIAGYYSNGTNVYQVNALGKIIAITSCTIIP